MALPTTIEADALLSPRQVAELTGYCDRQIRRKIAAGQLKAIRLSHCRVGIRVADYRDWLSAQVSAQPAGVPPRRRAEEKA
jgi:predicted DNA-binding transcriptional regulator AlpA